MAKVKVPGMPSQFNLFITRNGLTISKRGKQRSTLRTKAPGDFLTTLYHGLAKFPRSL